MSSYQTIAIIFLYIFPFIFSQKIYITNPPELISQFSTNSLQFSVSDFGLTQSNFKLTGRLIFNASNPYNDACSPLQPNNESSTNSFPISTIPRIFFISRGGCTFVQKARNVQSVGGQAILLVNNIPGEVDNILMIDDGTGNDIHIPLLLISQSDGEIIRSFLIQQYQQPYINPLETVIIDVELNNKLTDHINLELFYSSDDEDFYKFITEYKALQDEFENIITLRTMYFTHSVGNSSDPSDNCVSNGKYCAPIIKSNINGLNVVKEGIFQKCLGIVYNDKTSSLYDVGLYLSYFVEFYNMCYKTKRFNEQCREDVITLLNIDDRKVMHCVKASFKSNTLDDNVYLTKDNHVLERDYRLKKLYDVKSHPVAFVNQKFMDSKLTVHNVLGEVCLMLKKRPEFCVRYFESLKNKEKTYYIMVSVVVFVLVICNLIIFVVCRKYLFNKIKERIEMNSIDIDGRINNTIAKYFQLKDADSGDTTTNTNTVESVSLDNENENESGNNSGTVETQ